LLPYLIITILIYLCIYIYIQVGNKFYLVFPLCTGGELYEHVIRRGHFSEHDAAILMRDLISGLHELHKNKILHLDIKPENILFESTAEDSIIKITDFGLSKVIIITIIITYILFTI
jgi:serine/threonine protein kinase